MWSEDATGINASMKRRVAQRDIDHGTAILLRFALASYLSFLPDKHNSALSCFANNL